MTGDDLRIPALFRGSPVTCGFTTRRGGMSPPPFDSLNFGAGSADDQAYVSENYRLLREHAGVSTEQVALMRQVHSTTVREATDGGVYADTDGLVTNVPGLLLGVRVADCVPVLLVDPVRQAVGAIHCGWRPTVGGIAEHALKLMAEKYGSNPGDILAAAGPSAGPCCYEIGADTARHFRSASIIERGGALYADLKAELSSRLKDAGIEAEHMEINPDCTICNPGDYFSYRRDNVKSGRMIGFILLNGI